MRRMIRTLLSHTSRRKTHRNICSNPRLQRTRLALSALEERSVPAVYTVNALTDTGAGAGLLGDLRYCITQANASLGVPDTIVFDNATTGGQTITLAGELPILDDVIITGPTLKGPADPNVTINTSAAVRHFNINIAAVGGTASFSGLLLTGGAPGGSGGSVLLTSVDDNYNFTDTIFDSNTGANYGGAIGGAEPAGVPVYGTLNITRCKFTNNKNTLNFGGALALNVLISGAGVSKGYTCNITDTTFDNNQNERNGGCIFVRGYAVTLNVSNSTFSNNKLYSDGFGGTVSVLSGAGALSSTITFTNCTMSGNQNNDTVPGPPAGNGGAGGFFSNGGGATPIVNFRNCTLTNNYSAWSGGVFAASSGSPAALFDSCIIFGNSVGNVAGNTEFEGGLVSARNSIIFSKSGAASFTDLGGNFYGPTADPLLGPLQINGGGLVATHMPGDSSPAREAGNASSPVTVDANGVARPVGSLVDMGAIESIVDTPIAHASGLTDVTTVGGTKYSFTVTYYDGVAINKNTVGIGEIVVSGPLGDITPTMTSPPPGSSTSPIAVNYEFTPPGGSWAGTANGVYQLNVVANKVADTSGKFILAGPIAGGSFNVGVPKVYTVTSLGDTGAGAGDSGDLRYVINAANAFKGTNDSITFGALFNGGNTITLAGTELAITEAVTIVGLGANKVNINGGSLARIFNLTGPGSYTVNVADVTISGGSAAGDGGAFLISDETLNLTNVVLSGNAASGDGGAIVITSGGGKLNVSKSTFTGNSASLAGGAIATNANAFVNIDSSTFQSNSANQGGAVDLNLGNLSISNSTFAKNNAVQKGGAVSLTQVLGSLSISNSTFSGNTAGTNGGAIATDHAGGTLQIKNSTLTANTATANGGALYHNGTNAQPGNVNIISSIMAGNTSASVDVEVTAVTATFTTSLLGGTGGGGTFTPVGTNAPIGAPAILAPLGIYGSSTIQTHGILPGSPAIDAGSNPDNLPNDQRGMGFPRQVGAAVDIGAFEGVLPVPAGVMTPIPTIVKAGPTPNTVTVTYSDETGINVATLGTDDIEILAPDNVTKLTISGFKVDVMSNGTPRVVTYSFNPPANPTAGWDDVDNGTYTVSLVAGKVSDIDTPTPNSTFGQVIGSFKVAVPLIYTVDLASDDNNGNTTAGDLTLREAIILANADGQPSLIRFDNSKFTTPQTIITNNGEMFITASVTIEGPTQKLTFDANNNGRVFNIDDNLNSGLGISISDLAITKGTLVGGNGAGIFINDDPVTLTNVSITNSSSNVAGGGIYVSAGTPTLTLINCDISNNSSSGSTGGGININANGGTLIVQRSRITGNSAGTNGGGAYFLANGGLKVEDSTVADNKANVTTASLGGGGIYFFGATNATGVFISGSTFSGNSSGLGLGGGGLMVQAGSGTMTIQNSTFSGNTANTGAGGGYGGGLLINGGFGGTVTVTSSTFANNDAGKSGGGVAVTTGAMTMNSNIVAKNTVAGVGTAPGADLFSLTTTVTGANNLIGVNDVTTKMTFDGPTNPLIGTTGAPINPLLNPLALNGALAGSPLTHEIQGTSPAKNAGNNAGKLQYDQRGVGFNRVSGGTADIGAYEIQIAAAPPTATISVNNGAAQRSMVTTIKVTFSENVTIANPSAAFQLTRTKNGSAGAVNLNAVQSGADWTITFVAGGTVGVDPAGSLQDGTYLFTIAADQVQGAGGTLDGDGDGIAEGNPTDNKTQGLHRLFGDGTGDGAVNSFDFAQFRGFFGLAGPSPFDYDGNNQTNTFDFAQFRGRFGLSGYQP